MVLVPFSLMWCGMVVGLGLSALVDGADLASVIPVVPFAIMGLHFVAGRFVVPAVVSRRTRYTLTNARILVHGGWSGGRLNTAYLRSLPPSNVERLVQ